MTIGLTAKQRSDLAAMLPNIEQSIATLKRVIADTKDRTRALARLADAEEAQKRHATEVGIPFNAEAFARRRSELNSLPKVLTVEEGQLASFVSLQRAAGVILDGPFTRASRGAAGRKKSASRPAKARRGAIAKSAARPKKAGKSGKPSPRKRTRVLEPAGVTARPKPGASAPKPVPLSLGS